MKDIFNRRQRFSLRKYSFGVASVLLGTALFAAHTAQADEVTAPDASGVKLNVDAVASVEDTAAVGSA